MNISEILKILDLKIGSAPPCAGLISSKDPIPHPFPGKGEEPELPVELKPVPFVKSKIKMVAGPEASFLETNFMDLVLHSPYGLPSKRVTVQRRIDPGIDYDGVIDEDVVSSTDDPRFCRRELAFFVSGPYDGQTVPERLRSHSIILCPSKKPTLERLVECGPLFIDEPPSMSLPERFGYYGPVPWRFGPHIIQLWVPETWHRRGHLPMMSRLFLWVTQFITSRGEDVAAVNGRFE